MKRPWNIFRRTIYVFFNPPEDFKGMLKRPDTVSQLKWSFLIVKRFFDTGYTQTSYLKYAIALFGLTSLEIEKTLIIAGIYAVFCLFLGYGWFLFKFAEIETELGNRFNYFVSDMRKMKDRLEKNL